MAALSANGDAVTLVARVVPGALGGSAYRSDVAASPGHIPVEWTRIEMPTPANHAGKPCAADSKEAC
jgi:hypothetical protein